jgi:hypothetical protein
MPALLSGGAALRWAVNIASGLKRHAQRGSIQESFGAGRTIGTPGAGGLTGSNGFTKAS